MAALMNGAMGESSVVTIEELVELAAHDTDFFGSEFFPKAFRQRSPSFSPSVWRALEMPHQRLVNIQMFRGSAKTTRLRVLAAKRIAYGLSRTILYVGKSEAHAIRSVEWVRKQILFNERLCRVFGLRKGSKFQGTEAEIYHNSLDHPIWLVAAGIEGSLRGINLDDYRPDLIILDDVVADQNAATPEGRQKLSDLIFGAVQDSLAPEGEAPDAKMVLLNTPMNKEDPSVLALQDPGFLSLVRGCWTDDTIDLPLEQRQSVWPEMFPSDALIQRKQNAILRGQTHVFNREMECRLTDPETAPLKGPWLKHWQEIPERHEFSLVVMSIDPVPKASEVQIAKNLHGKDWEVIQVWGKHKSGMYLLDWKRNRGHEPNWTVATVFQLWTKWRPRLIAIDATAYQSTLAWILEQEMRRTGVYMRIEEIRDRRSKYDKILDAYSGPASLGRIFIPLGYSAFEEQWTAYPDVAHDDDLDAGHLALDQLNTTITLDDEAYYSTIEEGGYEPTPQTFYGAP